jgi:N-acetylglucosamine kinase-like BadF-type ATPase
VEPLTYEIYQTTPAQTVQPQYRLVPANAQKKDLAAINALKHAMREIAHPAMRRLCVLVDVEKVSLLWDVMSSGRGWSRVWEK